MESIRIEILNPKALSLLKNLADLKLISIEGKEPNQFADLLEKLRSKADKAPPSLEEITREVELVRKKRYGH